MKVDILKHIVDSVFNFYSNWTIVKIVNCYNFQLSSFVTNNYSDCIISYISDVQVVSDNTTISYNTIISID